MDFGLSIKGISIPTSNNSVVVSTTTTPPRKKLVITTGPSSPRSPSRTTLSSTIPVSPKRTNSNRNITKTVIPPVPESIVSSTTTASSSTVSEQVAVLPVETSPTSPPSIPSSNTPQLSVDDGTVRLRYNHYNDSFTIAKGCISPTVIIDKYCFNYVYKGNYKVHLLTNPNKEDVLERLLEKEELDQLSIDKEKYNIDNYNRIFIGLTKDTTYLVEIEDDPIEKQVQNSNRKQLNAQELTNLRLGIIQPNATTDGVSKTTSN